MGNNPTAVCTLPITSRTELPFRTTISPVYASFFANAVSGRLMLYAGKYGRNISPDNPQSRNSTYRELVNPRGSREVALHSDREIEYFDFMQQKIGELIERKHLSVEYKNVMSCECGISSFDADLIETLPVEKIKNVKQIGGEIICKHCDTELVKHLVDCLVVKPSFFASRSIATKIYPQYLLKKSQSMVLDALSHSRIVSKRDQGNYPQTEIGDRSICIDPDFWMAGVPLYSGSGKDRVVVTAGAEQHQRILMASSFWSHFRTINDFEAIVHPRMSFNTDVGFLGKIAAQEAVDQYGTTALRIVLGLGIQWKTHQSKIGGADLVLAHKTSEVISCDILEPPMLNNASDLMKNLNGNRFRVGLKKMRQRSVLTADDNAILYSVLG